MTKFTQHDPKLESYWRSVILFGRNVASYKFALGKSLLELSGQGKSFITLEELADPFSRNICEHLVNADKQGTSPSSRFLDQCRQFNAGEISHGELINATVQLGFQNVINAFPIVNQGSIPISFYIDDRKTKKGITLTDDLFRLSESFQHQNLPGELEARWRLVETAWELGISKHLLVVEYNSDGDILYVPSATDRVDITSSRDALNGYQKGKCFYCFDKISIVAGSPHLADVDHFFPHILKQTITEEDFNLDGVWNLMLACQECNRGAGGKFARIPEITPYLDRLFNRNEYLIDSHHPLRETLINQTGRTTKQRRQFLTSVDSHAITHLIHRWRTSERGEHAFPGDL